MDPISVSTGCIGLLTGIMKLSAQIVVFVSAVRDARRDMDAVSRELSSLSLCLGTLRDDSAGIEYPDGLNDNLIAVLKNCDSVIAEMTALLEKLSGTNVLRKIQWSITERDNMNKLRSSLECHKSALEIALEMTTLLLISAVKADVADVRTDTTAILDNTAQIPSIKQDTSQIATLVQEIGFLRLQLNETSVHDAKAQQMQRFLDESSTYAETVIDEVDQRSVGREASFQIAQSFLTAALQPSTTKLKRSSATAPDTRLSFITATDQAKFEQLFKSAVGNKIALDGEKARDLLLRSKLSGGDLMNIWNLSDTTKAGQLLFPEFALAMYLCNLRLTGKTLPVSIPENVMDEISTMMDAISFGTVDVRPPTPPLSRNRPPSPSLPCNRMSTPKPLLHKTRTWMDCSGSFRVEAEFIGVVDGKIHLHKNNGVKIAVPIAKMSQADVAYVTQLTEDPFTPYEALNRPEQLQRRKLDDNNKPDTKLLAAGVVEKGDFRNAPATTLPKVNASWIITKEEKKIYDDLFRAWDGFETGFLTGNVVMDIMGQSGLDRKDLEAIWTLSDQANRGRLEIDEFAVAMRLVYRKLSGYPVPTRLPPELDLGENSTGVR